MRSQKLWHRDMGGAADFKVGYKAGFARSAREDKFVPHFSKCGGTSIASQGWARGSFVEAEAEVEAERSRQRRGKTAMFLTEARQGRGRGRELEAEARQTKLEARPRRGRAKSMLFVSF